MKPDTAMCEECGWYGLITDCIEGEDGDWESGYFKVDDCPECGSPITNYDYGNAEDETY